MMKALKAASITALLLAPQLALACVGCSRLVNLETLAGNTNYIRITTGSLQTPATLWVDAGSMTWVNVKYIKFSDGTIQTSSATGGGGVASSWAGGRATSTIDMNSYSFTGSPDLDNIALSTADALLNPSNSNYIQLTDELLPGTTFHVSSGTVSDLIVSNSLEVFASGYFMTPVGGSGINPAVALVNWRPASFVGQGVALDFMPSWSPYKRDLRGRIGNEILAGGAGQLNFSGYESGPSGTLTEWMTINGTQLDFPGGGITVGAPTGGLQGDGTINATAIYDDGVQLTPNTDTQSSWAGGKATSTINLNGQVMTGGAGIESSSRTTSGRAVFVSSSNYSQLQGYNLVYGSGTLTAGASQRITFDGSSNLHFGTVSEIGNLPGDNTVRYSNFSSTGDMTVHNYSATDTKDYVWSVFVKW